MSASLTLFVSGDTAASRHHAVAIRNWCDRFLLGRYRLDVCDILEPSALAGQTQVLATPLLVLDSPPSRVVGDLSDVPRVMVALGLAAAEDHGAG